MALDEIVLDTNGYTAFRQGKTEAVDVMTRATKIYVSTIVLGELLAGFAIGTREAKNRTELQTFLASPRIQIVPVTNSTADWFARVYRDLRTKGRPVPTNDIWIAATARELDCALFTYDAHFGFVDGLTSGGDAATLFRP